MPTRKPYPSEYQFFFQNAGVPGYAAPDNQVVFNPFTMMDPRMKQAIMANELARIAMRQGLIPPYRGGLTKQQTQTMNTTPYYQTASHQDRVNTVLARLLSGDPSAGKGSKKQREYVDRLRLTVQGMR
jgi:hypothetical protein